VLGEQGMFVWDENDYALAITTRLGLEGSGGMVRIGAVHACEAHGNTVEEIQRLGVALQGMI
jgi:selenocysteine lyase/cysteine desulfurase